MSSQSELHIKMTETYGAHNYHPLPVVLSEGDGAWLKDVDGKRYLDFLSAYSAVNQGHCHPHIIKAATEQMNRLTLTSRAFYNDQLGPFLKRICEYSGFEMALPMNTGAEGVETAIKLARRFGKKKKGVQEGKQEIIVCENNFHGRTTTIISFSSDPDSKDGYGPFTPGFTVIPFNDLKALEKASSNNTVAFLMEPIQGEAGVNVFKDGYLKGARKICSEKKILFIADEIQTGLCRTGARFACDLEGVKPDVLILGKALGGGIFPVSVVLSSKEIMEVFTPGSHGSTFGGNPLACAIAQASLDVLEKEKLAERAHELGIYFREELSRIQCKKLIEIRGKGLLNAVVFEKGFEAWDVCVALKNEGLLAKQTHGNIIRFAPPLVITKEELDQAMSIIRKVFERI